MAKGTKKFCSIFLIVLVAFIGIVYQCYNNQNFIYKFVITRAFNSFEYGTLCLKYINDNNKIERYGHDTKLVNNSECSVTIILNDENLFFSTMAISGGATGFGESYFKGYWSAENDNKLTDIVYHIMYNQLHRSSKFGFIMEYVLSVKHLFLRLKLVFLVHNDQNEDKKAIEHHYDVGNDFYQTFLGTNLSGYSCAIFNKNNDTLNMAQDNKWDIVIKKANINNENEKLKVVDIGCGWGYFPSYINNKTGSFVVGITISSKQYNFMNNKYRHQIRNKQILYNNLDYRDLYKTYGSNYFDRAVSIGMLEHVGYNNLNIYFESIWNVLKPGSYFLLHYISRMDIHPKMIERKRSTACQQSNFINTYIFPSGCTLHTNWVYQAADETGFILLHEEHYAKHYSKTANIWKYNLEKNKEKIINNAKYDIQLYKMYQFYFAFGESALRSGLIELVQQIYYKPSQNKYNVKWNHNITMNPHNC